MRRIFHRLDGNTVEKDNELKPWCKSEKKNGIIREYDDRKYDLGKYRISLS